MTRALVILLVLWPALALAEPLYIRSGEHADFTRLYIRFGTVPEWSFGRVEGGYELRSHGAKDGYALEPVFEFIPKTRIFAAENRGGGRLFLAVDCICHADVFAVGSGLVVDIKTGSAPAQNPFNEALPGLAVASTEDPAVVGSPSPRAGSAFPLTLGTHLPAARTVHAWVDGLAVDPSSRRSPVDPPPETAAISDPLATSSPPGHTETAYGDGHDGSSDPHETGEESETGTHDPGGSERALALQAELVTQIGRAVSMGLVEADLSDTAERVASAHPDPTDETEALADPVAVAPDPLVGLEVAADAGNMRIETAIDRNRSPSEGHLPQTADGAGCRPEGDFDISAWGEPPHAGGSRTLPRDSLIGEFDAADHQGVARLARNYIYLTFGAEAQALLTAFEIGGEDAVLLTAMADIMDKGRTDLPVPAANQLACDGRVALWALLARPAASRGDLIDREAVLTGFAELPLHLRRHLAPVLAGRFLDIGDTDTASAVRNTVSRAPGDHGEGFAMMEAEISIGLGDPDRGTRLFNEVATNDGSRAPDAVVRLIDTAIETGRPLPDKIAITAGSLAFEARGTAMGRELARVQVRAIAHSGDVLGALDAARDAAEDHGLDAETILTLRGEIFALAAGVDAAPVFLQSVLSGPLDLGESPEASATRRIVASRLIELGLPGPARSILSATTGVPEPEDRLLYAEAFLREHRPELAIGYLAGLNDAEATALRAKAHSLAGEFTRAASAYADIGETEARSRAIWRDQDWTTAANVGSDLERAAALLAIQSEPGVEDGAGPLARNRALLQRSGETRAVLNNLLAGIAIP